MFTSAVHRTRRKIGAVILAGALGAGLIAATAAAADAATPKKSNWSYTASAVPVKTSSKYTAYELANGVGYSSNQYHIAGGFDTFANGV